MSDKARILRTALTLLVAFLLASAFGLALAPGRGLTAPLPTPPPPSSPSASLLTGRTATAPPQRGDLSIHYIARTPRYPRYCLDYARNVPELCAGSAEAKHFPDPGEPVTLTAHILNQGALTTPATPFTWTVDGQVAQTGVLGALSPGQETNLMLGWRWQTGAHTLTLELAPAGAEISLANNILAHRSDAHYLEVWVHPLFVQAFAGRKNLVGSYSFADWLQAQFAQMNQRLAAAAYPGLPEGLPDRIRVDVISVTTAVGGDIVSSTLDYDGRWTFRPAQDYKATPEDEAWESVQNYASAFASTIDWGLVHELAHQLGVIDLYQLNVSPSAGNQVVDNQGLPLLSGFYWTQPGLMGGDYSPRGGTHFSEHTALALAQNSGYRRGYFGEYLFDLPDDIWVEVRDRAGNALADVAIQVYQTRWNTVQAEPVITGTTDTAGHFLLPNRPVSPTLTTATGHQFRANPLGAIDVVGRNGQLLLRLQRGNQEAFRWLPITELNKAAWRGQRAFTLTLPTHFSPPDQALPQAPAAVDVQTQGESATLRWQAVADAASYNLYQGLWPKYYPFTLVAQDIPTTTYHLELERSSRFAVTAVSGAGVESDFSNVVRAEVLYAPAGLFWDDADALSPNGSVLVLDSHSGAMLKMLPPLCANGPCHASWVGRVGSEHFGMVGGVAMTPGPGHTYGVALGGAQRVWVFDASQRPLNWFGRVSSHVDSPLEQPGGLLLRGDPFRVYLPLARPDPEAFLLLTFDGVLSDSIGISPQLAEGVHFAPGLFGQAAFFEPGARLQYPAGSFPASQGGVEFWLKPRWPGASKTPHVLFDAGSADCEIAGAFRSPENRRIGESTWQPGATPADRFQILRAKEGKASCGDYRLLIGQSDGGLYAWYTNFDDISKAAWAEIQDWQPDEWHHVAVTWGEGRLNLYLDGRLAWAEAMPAPFTGVPAMMAVGSALSGEDAADALIDSLRISALPRLGNSDAVQVLVSEALTGAVKVFDLLGNLLSIYIPEDDGLHRYGQMAAAPDGSIWLLDAQTGSMEKLRLDGQQLHRVASLVIPLEDTPRALAASPSGLLALAAGDRVLLVDPDRPDPLLALWDAPDDGAAEPFRQPAALAFGPRGELAVAEMGNRRVSFILDARPAQKQFLPLTLVAQQ